MVSVQGPMPISGAALPPSVVKIIFATPLETLIQKQQKWENTDTLPLYGKTGRWKEEYM